MGFVGLDPEAATHLVGLFDQAVRELNAHAQSIEQVLRDAGISSGAPGTLRHCGLWADYRRRDLQKRIDKVIAADSGGGGAVPAGFRFDNPAQAKKAGIEAANKIKSLLHDGKLKEAEAE